MVLTLERAKASLWKALLSAGCALAFVVLAPTGSRADVWDWVTGNIRDDADMENASLSGTDLPPDAIVTGPSETRPIQLGRDLIELFPATAVTFEVNGEKTTVHLLMGTIRAKVAKRKKRQRFEVETVHLVATVKGTDFEVSTVGGASAVSVHEGRVAVKAVGRVGGLDVTAGKTATVTDADREPNLGSTPPGSAAAAAKALARTGSTAGSDTSTSDGEEDDAGDSKDKDGRAASYIGNGGRGGSGGGADHDGGSKNSGGSNAGSSGGSGNDGGDSDGGGDGDGGESDGGGESGEGGDGDDD